MAWSTSNRRARLPRGWAAIRKAVLDRAGHQCQHIRADTGLRCTERATDADHIHAGDDDSMTNLQALCSYHHKVKSSREGGQARATPAPVVRHPGLIN